MYASLGQAIQENCGIEYVQRTITEDRNTLNTPDADKRTPFHWACSMGKLDIAEYLLKQVDIKADEKDEAGWTPLMVAICNKAIPDSFIETLMERSDVNIETTTRGGQTCLHYASGKGRLNIVQKLCERSPRLIRTRDLQGQQPLHRAAAVGNSNVVKYLLSQKCPLNASDSFGFTALHFALAEGHPDIAIDLIKSNADTLRTDKEGHTALDVCMDRSIRQEFIGRCKQEGLDL
ncbi:proteasome regulatory particle [Schizosaccharomyces octosporus yFS286]|uniref:Proteasome regulatory particle n=1 Tax=Schizosaccharomyces octosporus (strain yFS286) TaxID=483514 RepID=S9QWK0_SCHOY|nr:proteasome regulatory particle [Schizosaccharomyces octosporus yFS286]EPX70675.1 proteasome regulatory particle [Schizosaccharomyces octosporus yFS286]